MFHPQSFWDAALESVFLNPLAGSLFLAPIHPAYHCSTDWWSCLSPQLDCESEDQGSLFVFFLPHPLCHISLAHKASQCLTWTLYSVQNLPQVCISTNLTMPWLSLSLISPESHTILEHSFHYCISWLKTCLMHVFNQIVGSSSIGSSCNACILMFIVPPWISRRICWTKNCVLNELNRELRYSVICHVKK